METVDNLHWRIFLALEEELCSTQNFVDFSENNRNVYSIKFRSIILQACSEIEKILKLISRNDQGGLKEQAEYFLDHHSGFSAVEIVTYTYMGTLKPWYGWPASPAFWRAYNSIKHDGKSEASTLENALQSMAALFSVLLAWMIEEYGDFPVRNPYFPAPKLFYYNGIKITGMARRALTLPGDFKKKS